METRKEEAVGLEFREDVIQTAQDRGWSVLKSIAQDIHVGMSEKEGRDLALSRMREMGSERNWHPPQVRFGCNTTLGFAKPGTPDVVLSENDIFFLDLGPVFNSHEADVGATFVVGSDPEMHKLVQDSKVIFDRVHQKWRSEKVTGCALYDFAEAEALTRGWHLMSEGASGHRVSDFPHAIHYRGKLKTFDHTPTPLRWILEIQIKHPTRAIGAFYEDILNAL